MKWIAILMLISLPAFAQIPKMPGMKELTKKVLEACKEDKSKISGCEAYTDVSKLKTCLMENKDKLSEKCKQALKLVK